MRQRQLIQKQIAELQRKAAARPGPNDPAGMVGFGATLLAAQMQIWLLKADFEQGKKEGCDEQSSVHGG